jgi:uncharacterized integral membrane protein (TIGR00698 family)
MSSMISTAKHLVPGLLVVASLSAFSMWGAEQPVMRALRISPLIVGILMGAVIGNVAGAHLPSSWGDGITFSAKKILRLAIILYGFRITFAQIADVGMAGFVLDVLMVSLTLFIGIFVGTRWLGMDKETAIMTSCGAAICGAAAVVATEPVVKAEAHQTAIAVATVVIFGTIAMFLYPLVYRTGIVPMTEDIFGIYIGASVHEVAHVVGAGEAVSAATANTAVIVKMTRVMLLAPALLAIGWFLNRQESKETDAKTALVIPWFAVGFVAVAGFNSLGLLGEGLVQQLIDLDTFLLTMAMTALGLSTVVSKFKGIGWKPIQLALVLAVWLVVGGFVLTQVLMSL